MRPVCWADNLTTFVCRLFRNPASLSLLELKGLVQLCRQEIAKPKFVLSDVCVSVHHI